MPAGIENDRRAHRPSDKRIPRARPGRENPNFLSDTDDNLDSGRDSVASESSTTSYSSTCTQTSDASTNSIDSNLRVIHRPGSNVRRLPTVNDVRGRVVYRMPARSGDGFTKYILRRDINSTAPVYNSGKERVILRKRSNSLEGTGRVLLRTHTNSKDKVFKERPSSYHARGDRVVERRVLRPLNTSGRTDDKVVRRQIIKKVVKPESSGKVYERRIIRKEEPTRRVITRQVGDSSDTERRVIRRIITRQPSEVSRQYVVPVDNEVVSREIVRRSRPSSYDGRIVESKPMYVERRPRPSSYHNGMEREYIAIKQNPDNDNVSYQEKVLEEYQMQNNEKIPTKTEYNKEKWVDEYDVPDTETRDVGVQMTTHYKVPDPPAPPPKPETRNVGVQARFEIEEKIVVKEVPVPAPPKKKKKKVKPPPTPSPPPLSPPPTPTPPPSLPPEPKPQPKPRYIFVKKPKMKSQYVRVGGGWMKIDHYRNHHIPLQIFEHDRTARDAKKFLSIKYRYTKDRKRTPVAWSKYRSHIAKDS